MRWLKAPSQLQLYRMRFWAFSHMHSDFSVPCPSCCCLPDLYFRREDVHRRLRARDCRQTLLSALVAHFRRLRYLSLHQSYSTNRYRSSILLPVEEGGIYSILGPVKPHMVVFVRNCHFTFRALFPHPFIVDYVFRPADSTRLRRSVYSAT